MSTSLARRATIQALVATYQAECERIRKAFAEIADAEWTLRSAFLSATLRVPSDRYGGRSGEWDDPEAIIARLRRPVWEAIVERLELRRVMSASRWEECQRWLYRGELPEITLETVTEHAAAWVGSIPDMLDEAMREAFEYLRPRNSKHKANSELEIPPKVILTGVMDSRVWSMLSTWHGPRLAAVERVFKSLDGKGQTTAGYYSDLEVAIREAASAHARKPGPFGCETDYFRVRVFGNGNAHIWFKRLDLLAKLNAIAGGKRLRPARVA